MKSKDINVKAISRAKKERGVLCPYTRLIVGWHLSMSKEFENAKEVLRKAKNRFPIGYELKEVVTDGENGFPRAIWEVFDHSVIRSDTKGSYTRKITIR